MSLPVPVVDRPITTPDDAAHLIESLSNAERCDGLVTVDGDERCPHDAVVLFVILPCGCTRLYCTEHRDELAPLYAKHEPRGELFCMGVVHRHARPVRVHEHREIPLPKGNR